MWRLARLVRRGLKSSGGGIENRFGLRNAVVKTTDGQLWHISDKTYCVSYYRPFMRVPAIKRDRNGPHPYPTRDQTWILINTTGAKAAHGLHPEPTHWMLASSYWENLRSCMDTRPQVQSIAQPGVLSLVKDYTDSCFGPTSRHEWLELERRKTQIMRQGVTPGYLEFIKSYYLLGQPLRTALSVL
jgi:hypothetical protein